MAQAFQPEDGSFRGPDDLFFLGSELRLWRTQQGLGSDSNATGSPGRGEPLLRGPENLARRDQDGRGPGEDPPALPPAPLPPAPSLQPTEIQDPVSAQRGPARLESLTFASKSEAVCGLMLEKYVPNFELVPGETFQIGVGSKRFDFKIDGVFIEFHPVQLRNDFTSQQAYQNLQAALGRFAEWQRNELNDILRDEFGGQYAKRRRDILNCFEATRNAELIICHDREDFARRVLRRFSGPGIPSEAKLLAEFETLYRGMSKRFQYVDPEAS